MTETTLADRVAEVYLAVAQTSGIGAGNRQTAMVDGVRCVVHGVDEPWGCQAVVMHEPRAEAVAAARAWLLARGPGWIVMTRARYRSHPVLAGLGGDHPMPALVLGEPSSGDHEVAGVTIGVAREPTEFLPSTGPCVPHS